MNSKYQTPKIWIRLATCTLYLFICTHALHAGEFARLDELIAAGDLNKAANEARSLDAKAGPTIDLTMPMARLGRAYEKQNDLPQAAEFYSRAVIASEQPAASSLSRDKVSLVRLAAAGAMTAAGKLTEAINTLRGLIESPSAAGDAQVQAAVGMCLNIGSTGLATGDFATAAEAYRLAEFAADERQRPIAMLGSAWTVAVSQVRPLEAAQKLAAFVQAYPGHADAARATRACAECLRQADRPADANAMLADLLDRWPESDSALEVVRGYSDLASDLIPPSVRSWVMAKAKSNDLRSFDAKATTMGLLIATEVGDQEAWANLARHLAAMDQSGNSVADLLNSLTEKNHSDQAERFAASLISPSDVDKVSPGGREAACRWAGRNQRWSMLALASESAIAKLDSPPPNRTDVVERLFAESLMQLGRVNEASRWWNYLVDVRQSTDFATLLRCAEAETSVGDDVSLAGQRISLARAATGDEPFNTALVDMLAAELAIRKTRFEEARSLLESVVRTGEIDATLRGRAQWLIGETHYLQAQFGEAIEAYRRVEGIDGGGVWVSASLVQAGKSFEQLGRTREAAVCYGTLIGRFADSSHAEIARKRMAAIDPSNPTSNSSIRR